MNRKERRRAKKTEKPQREATKVILPTHPLAQISNFLLQTAGAASTLNIADVASPVMEASSGDGVAAAFAAWRGQQELSDALKRVEEGLVRQPNSYPLHFKRAGLLRELRRFAEAVEAYRKCQSYDPDNAEITHMIAALGGDVPPPQADARYVTKLFDSFADRFDETLVHWLNYRGPEVVLEAFRRSAPHSDHRYDIIDLGCGTGLAAPLFRSYAACLDGIDLSPKMLEKAAEQKLYDHLQVGDIVAKLQDRPLQYDVALAVDVLVYVGAVEAIFQAAAAALRPDGFFIFTVEKSEQPGFALRPSGRYAHHCDYVDKAAQDAGFVLLERTEPTVRFESRKPVPAYCFVLQKQIA